MLGALPWDRPQLTRSSNPHLEIMCQHLPPPNIALKGKSKCNLAFLQRALTYWQMRHSVRARIEMHFGRISSFFLLLYLDHCSCTALKDTESLQRKQCTWLQSFTLCFALHCSALTSLVTGFPQCDYRDGLHQSTRAPGPDCELKATNKGPLSMNNCADQNFILFIQIPIRDS